MAMIKRRSLIKNSVASVAVGTAAIVGFPNIFRTSFAGSKGEFKSAILSDPLSFDPHLAGNLQGRGAAQTVHDKLFIIDNKGRLAPSLAISWKQTDDVSFIIDLRKNVKFQDGTKFDAESVKYNLERIRDPKIKSIRAGEISALDTISVISSHQIKLKLKYPFAAFLYPLTDVAGCIGSPTAMESSGQDYALNPVGTGPFKLVEYMKDSHSVMERNGDYWNIGKPKIDTLIFKPIPTHSTRLAELRSGAAHLAEAMPLQDIKRLSGMSEVVVSEMAGFRWEYFGFNCRSEYPGHSKKFRQAFQWAIDREALHAVAYFGTGEIGYDGILPSSPFHDPNYKPFTRNLDKAKRLIEESGISTPVTIIAPLRSDDVKTRAAQIFQANAEEIGVKIVLEQTDRAGYLTMLKGGTLPIDVQGWWGYRPDPDQYLNILYDSKGRYAKRHGYSNPEMDKLILAERQGRTEQERRRAFRALAELGNEDAVYVPWHYSSDFKGLSPKVKGFVHPPNGIVDYTTVSL
jgi:peptide/nickel transport system substrate-binding protein